jgi:hypothetical protein
MDRAEPDLVVNFVATNMPLSRLGRLFDLLFPEQILIPASRIDELVTTDGPITSVKLGDLIERIGLIPSQKPLVGRELSNYVGASSSS